MLVNIYSNLLKAWFESLATVSGRPLRFLTEVKSPNSFLFKAKKYLIFPYSAEGLASILARTWFNLFEISRTALWASAEPSKLINFLCKDSANKTFIGQSSQISNMNLNSLGKFGNESLNSSVILNWLEIWAILDEDILQEVVASDSFRLSAFKADNIGEFLSKFFQTSYQRLFVIDLHSKKKLWKLLWRLLPEVQKGELNHFCWSSSVSVTQVSLGVNFFNNSGFDLMSPTNWVSSWGSVKGYSKGNLA